MIEFVRRGFDILNSLIFNDKVVCYDVLEKLLEDENIVFISDVARITTFADQIIRNIFEIDDKNFRLKINNIFLKHDLMVFFIFFYFF
jgi:hypothetical protein